MNDARQNLTTFSYQLSPDPEAPNLIGTKVIRHEIVTEYLQSVYFSQALSPFLFLITHANEQLLRLLTFL